jgi:hydroxyacylglutathione hydrolase
MLNKTTINNTENNFVRAIQISRKDYYNQNTYIIIDKFHKLCFIIDPGDNSEIIITEINKQNIHPTAILLTHGHFDHIGAANNLSVEFNIPCFMHKNDFKLLNSAQNYALLFEKKHIQIPQEIKSLDEFSWDVPKILFTPGHTKGSCCFEFYNFVCTGDTLLFETSGRTDLPGGSKEDLIMSLAMLDNYLKDETIVLPGHGNSFNFHSLKNKL